MRYWTPEMENHNEESGETISPASNKTSFARISVFVLGFFVHVREREV